MDSGKECFVICQERVMHPIIAELEKEYAKKRIDDFMIGDTVDVHVRIIEGEKERIQIFNGVVIAKNKGGINENFTVRRLVAGEGVERVFPLHAPRVEKVEVRRRGRSKRAKLYYLRDRVGKSTRLREETRPSRSLAREEKAEKRK
jgi:large subunit ribosomal protein L19